MNLAVRIIWQNARLTPLYWRTSRLSRLRSSSGEGIVEAMSTKAQAILDEIRALPPQEFQAVWQQIQRWGNSRQTVTPADDPIQSARGMFAGSRLTKALLASRAEDRRRG
jgi:putative heme iron utilization protein